MCYFTDDIDRISLEEIGSRLEADAHFRENKCGVCAAPEKNLLRMRVWERGTGVTMACGTGTCATVVAAILNGLVEGEAEVILDGGNLHISWEGDSSAHVFMTGPAEKVFEGEYII